DALQFVAESGHFRELRRRIETFALGDADLFRQRVAPRLQLLRAHLQRLALAFQRFEFSGVERYAALRQSRRDGGQIVAQQVDVEHRGILPAGRAALTLSPAARHNVDVFNNQRAAMATVNFSVPEEVKRLFNRTFARENKSRVVAGLLLQAVAER